MMEEPEVDRLYALPLAEFTPARDQLASRLKTAGDAAEAARIKALRKPTVPAWTVNQLARRYPKQVDALIAASERLRQAHHELLQGASAGDLWEATLTERESVGDLLKAAEWILKESGLGAARATLERIADTLYGAAADPTGRTLLRRGLLSREMRRSGFGEMIAPPSPSPRAKAPPKPSRPEPKTPKVSPAPGPTSKQVLEAERGSQRALREAERADAEAKRLDRLLRRADEEAAQARKRADAAARAAAAAKAEATRARREAADARREAGRAEARLDKLRRSRG